MINLRDKSAMSPRTESDLAPPSQREAEHGKAEKLGNALPYGPPPRRAVKPDPEVPAVLKRRQFPAAYKARIVEEAGDCTEPGAIGALLRREGLYSSQLSSWRELYRTVALQALRDDKRGRKPTRHPLEDENEKMRKQNERLADRLAGAEMIIDIQKKSGYDAGDSPEQRRERRHEMIGAVKEYVQSEAVMFCLLVHELLHPMFGHFIYSNENWRTLPLTVLSMRV